MHVSHKKWYKYYKCFVNKLTQTFSEPIGENFRRILDHLYYIKLNEINIYHHETQFKIHIQPFPSIAHNILEIFCVILYTKDAFVHLNEIY